MFRNHDILRVIVNDHEITGYLLDGELIHGRNGALATRIYDADDGTLIEAVTSLKHIGREHKKAIDALCVKHGHGPKPRKMRGATINSMTGTPIFKGESPTL